MPRELFAAFAVLLLAAGAQAGERPVVSAPKGFVPPKLIEFGPFDPPDDADVTEPGGDVVVDLFVNEEGTVDEVQIVSAPTERLARVARGGAAQARFVPGHLGLEAHRGWVRCKLHLVFGPPTGPEAAPKSPPGPEKAPVAEGVARKAS